MPQLNRDLLREVLYELIKQDGFNESIDKFMLTGKEQFQLVLNISNNAKADSLIIFKDRIYVQLPGIEYEQMADDDGNEKSVIGTKISTKIKLFKPISIALATTIESLDIRSFSPKLIPMLNSVDWGLDEVKIKRGNLKKICNACINVPTFKNVTIENCSFNVILEQMQSFSFPCQKPTIIDGDCRNSHLHNIHNLAIDGRFRKTRAFYKELKQFAAFLSTNFPNLETINITFEHDTDDITWDWNDYSIANIFDELPCKVKGCISFKLSTFGTYIVNHTEYPDVQKDGDEYYIIFPISDTLSLQFIHKVFDYLNFF